MTWTCHGMRHVRQLDAVAARSTAALARHAPIIATGAEGSFLDIDDTVRLTFGYAKQGGAYGYSGVKGLNALLATVSTATTAPVIVATRLRKESANSARALPDWSPTRSRQPGRAGWPVCWCCAATAPTPPATSSPPPAATVSGSASPPAKDKAVTAAIPDDAWITIEYRAVFDEQLQQWVSDAEVAEVPFTAFASRGGKHAVTARLIVRRVRDQNPDHVQVNAQGELFRVWRHHGGFTDSPRRSCRPSPTIAAARSPNRSTPT